jgi:8-oxo-dGTP pyrophosphatase MutT (NUDIX family)
MSRTLPRALTHDPTGPQTPYSIGLVIVWQAHGRVVGNEPLLKHGAGLHPSRVRPAWIHGQLAACSDAGARALGIPIRSKNPRMAVRSARTLNQYGALPYWIADDGNVRLLLVTSRGRRDWIIPKGWPIPKLTAAATAAREAYEEAGLIGTIVGEEPVGYYRYAKQRASWRTLVCEVAVYLFSVERQLRKWPEKAERETRWFTPEEAAKVVVAPGLAEIVRAGTNHIQFSA